MLKGIKNKPYIDISNYIDLKAFDNLHPEISRGIATAKNIAHCGMVDTADGRINVSVYNNKLKPLYLANKELRNLEETNPYKLQAENLEGNELATYLKYAFGGYDLYTFYVLCDFYSGWRTSDKKNVLEVGNHFPEVISWIYSLVDAGIFSHIGRAIFFVQEAGGISIEHSDDPLDQENLEIPSEFIHIQNLDRPFYLRDNETSEKTYINARVSYFNDQDWHGGDPVLKPTYAFRVDGVFTDEFRNKILGESK
jgi:hypothetical protein